MSRNYLEDCPAVSDQSAIKRGTKTTTRKTQTFTGKCKNKCFVNESSFHQRMDYLFVLLSLISHVSSVLCDFVLFFCEFIMTLLWVAALLDVPSISVFVFVNLYLCICLCVFVFVNMSLCICYNVFLLRAACAP